MIFSINWLKVCLIFMPYINSSEKSLEILTFNKKLLPTQEQNVMLKICLLKIVKKFLTEHNLIILGNNVTSLNSILDPKVFSMLISENDMTVIAANSGSVLPKYDHRFTNYFDYAFLIVFYNIQELENAIKCKRRNQMWSPSTKFIVAYICKQKCVESSKIAKLLWKENIYNFVLVVSDIIDYFLQEIYIWKPFEKGHCGDKFETHVIGKCYHGKLSVSKYIFGNKFPRTYNRCSINVGASTLQPFVEIDFENATEGSPIGYEVHIMKIVTQKLGVSLNYSIIGSNFRDRGIYYKDNESFTGMLTKLADEEVDVVIGGYGVTSDRMEHFDLVYSHFLEAAVWCAPHAQPIPQWQVIFRATDSKTLTIIVVLLFIFSICIRILSTLKKELNSYKNFQDCFLKLYGSTLGITIPREPRTNVIRFLCLNYFIYSLIIVTTFRTELTSSMMNPHLSEQADTAEELLATNWTLRIEPTYKHFFFNKSHDIVRRILARWNPCEHLGTCLQEIAYNKTVALLGPKITLIHKSYWINLKARKPLIYCFEKNVRVYSLHLLVRKNFFLYSQLNMIIVRMSATGILQRWIRSRTERIFKKISRESEVISMGHLQAAYFLYTIGLFLSLIVFALEKICYRIKVRTFIL